MLNCFLKAKELQIPIARLILDDQGFVQVRMAPAERHTLANAKEILASIEKLCDGQRYPNLVDIRLVKASDIDARNYYGKEAHTVVSATAFLTNSLVTRLIANFFISLGRPAAPARVFEDENEAFAWLAAEHDKGHRKTA